MKKGFLLCLLLLVNIQVNAELLKKQNIYTLHSSNDNNISPELVNVTTPIYSLDSILDWPRNMAVHKTTSLRAGFTSFGVMGFPLNVTRNPYDTIYYTGFESPINTGAEYLWGSWFWLGGIVNGDTLVSVSCDGYLERFEFVPDNGLTNGNINPINHLSDNSYRVLLADTVHLRYADIDHKYHTPQNLFITMISHSYDESPYNNAIVYDLQITNRGSETIQDCYFGILTDADVGGGDPFASPPVRFDDYVFSIKEHGIGYIIDNDGDYNPNYYSESAHKALAIKLMYSSVPLLDTNFNWMTIGFHAYDYEFSPRKKPTVDDPWYEYISGMLGRADGNVDKYYLLQHDEWDYDQIDISRLEPNDSDWIIPDTFYSNRLSKGYDIRFLLSYGPYTLPPDSSVRFVYMMFTADTVVPPNIGALLPEEIDKYKKAIRTDALIDVVDNIKNKVDELTDPFTSPVTGVNISDISTDSFTVTWDKWISNGNDGFLNSYEILVSELPDSAMPYPGTVPPWYYVEFPNVISYNNTSSDSISIPISSFKKDTYYAVNIAHQTEKGTGNIGVPVTTTFWPTDIKPDVEEFLFYENNESITIRWSYPDSLIQNIKSFRVYQFSNKYQADSAYHACYDTGFKKQFIQPRDSIYKENHLYFYYTLEPLISFPASIDSFIINDPSPGSVFKITAVTHNNIESEFSNPVTVENVFPKNKDILIITGGNQGYFTNYEHIKDFYTTTLEGFSFDIYNFGDTSETYNCLNNPNGCFNWKDLSRYRLIIIDDDWREDIFYPEIEEYTNDFIKYIYNGGKLAYFGSLSEYQNYDLDDFYHISDITDSFISKVFGVDSITFYGLTYYIANELPLYTDSLFGFYKAVASNFGRDVIFSQSTHPLENGRFLTLPWDSTSIPSIATFIPNNNSKVIYRFHSRYPNSSLLENQPIGIHTKNKDFETFLFGFHLWYMQPSGARYLINSMLITEAVEFTYDKVSLLPDQLTLRQNYPNPFNPNTTISFELPRKSQITLEIYNILGQNVISLISDEIYPAGVHTVEWDGKTNSNQSAASGIYLYRLVANDRVISKKMMLLK